MPGAGGVRGSRDSSWWHLAASSSSRSACTYAFRGEEPLPLAWAGLGRPWALRGGLGSGTEQHQGTAKNRDGTAKNRHGAVETPANRGKPVTGDRSKPLGDRQNRCVVELASARGPLGGLGLRGLLVAALPFTLTTTTASGPLRSKRQVESAAPALTGWRKRQSPGISGRRLVVGISSVEL